MQPTKRGIRGRNSGWRLRAAVTVLGLAAACLSVAGTAASGPASAPPCPWCRRAAAARAP